MIKDTIWARRILSAFLLFHLFGVINAPNPGSFLNQAISPVYRPYLNFFGLASTWSFFAPEPFYLPVYIDYVVNRKDKLPVNGRFPDERNPYLFRDRYNRRIALTRIVLMNDENVRNMWVHYLCEQYPDMENANLWKVMATEPTLEMVRSGQKKITDAADTKIEVLGTYYCPEKSPGGDQKKEETK
jgi:hypothetical protein